MKFDNWISFDDDAAEDLISRMIPYVPGSNFVTSRTAEDQICGLDGELKAFADCAEWFIGRDGIVEILNRLLDRMTEAVFGSECEEEREDDDLEDYTDDDLEDYTDDDLEDYMDDDGEFDMVAYVHNEDSDRPYWE